MPNYNLRIGNSTFTLASTETALSDAVGKRLAGEEPLTDVDSAGGRGAYSFQGQELSFDDLREIKDM